MNVCSRGFSWVFLPKWGLQTFAQGEHQVRSSRFSDVVKR